MLNVENWEVSQKPITKTSKAYAELLKYIDKNDIMTMDSVALLTILQQGNILPNSDVWDDIIFTEANSNERKELFDKLKLGGYKPKHKIDDVLDEDYESNDIKTCSKIFTNTINGKNEDGLSCLRDIKSIDKVIAINDRMYDNEAIHSLIVNKTDSMLNCVCNGTLTIDEILEESKFAGEFYKKVVDMFVEEYNNAIKYQVPNGFSANKNGKAIIPNLMQKLFVLRLCKKRYYGNWSGTGAGKTLASIIASREIGSHLTVVVCNNSTVEQWKNDILNAYPYSTGTRVYTVNDGSYKDINFNLKNYNYLIIPYSRFSQIGEEDKLKNISDSFVEFVIMDEVHNAKQRGESDDKASNRRKRLIQFLKNIKDINNECYVCAMSATPVINDISEAKSLLLLLTGNSYDDVCTKRNITNAVKMHNLLVINGFRYKPKYQNKITTLTSKNYPILNINGNNLLTSIKSETHMNVERMLIDYKLISLGVFLKKGLIIYTHYTDGGRILQKIADYVNKKGFTCAIYSDNDNERDDELKKFINGERDILVSSDPVTTGVDGLQNVCDTMFIVTLPWTNAIYEQLIGRIYRQGMSNDSSVRIIIPQVIISNSVKTWSWDIQRFDLIGSKKTLADCITDGVVPCEKFPSEETLFKKTKEQLEKFGDVFEEVETALCDWKTHDEFTTRTPDDEFNNINIVFEDKQRNYSNNFISNEHAKVNTELSSTTHNRYQQNKNILVEYHKHREIAKNDWAEDPVDYVKELIEKSKRRKCVVDMGCGVNKLSKIIGEHWEVIGVDHININGDRNVIESDIANVSQLDNETQDIAVYCLSLWGKNYMDYFKEAHRILSEEGRVIIVEPVEKFGESERFGDIENFKVEIEKYGFDRLGIEEKRDKFVYFQFQKK